MVHWLNKTGNTETKIAKPMNTENTVFQTEVQAVQHGVRTINRTTLRDEIIKIYTDSKPTIQALENKSINSKIVLKTAQQLQILSRKNKVTLQWIPSHSGYAGNETADELANQGRDEQRDNGTKYPYPHTYYINKITDHFQVNLKKQWEGTIISKETNSLLKNY